jgi:hypothetical protein|tara:strand:+ start:1031 stop:1762 length:732 start_codon:yes stop_codon:yes gene_type:complete
MNLNSFVKRLLPESLKFRLHKWLKMTSSYVAIGSKGSLVAKGFDQVKGIPGWFTLDDCEHFHLVMEMQSMNGVTGDMLEIGSYHGRSTAIMAGGIRSGECIHVCDAFESDTSDGYSNKPSPEKLLANIQRVNPDIDLAKVKIHQCLSDDLSFPEDQKFRFIHIDGGHSAEQVYSDMELAKRHLALRGIVVIDDYGHHHWPTVSEGVDKFMIDNPDFSVLGDLNRHGALGRKLYVYMTSKNSSS